MDWEKIAKALKSRVRNTNLNLIGNGALITFETHVVKNNNSIWWQDAALSESRRRKTKGNEMIDILIQSTNKY